MFHFKIACSGFLVLAGIVSHSGAASFRGLGDLPGGQIGSWANAVSADGSVVVGRSLVHRIGSDDVFEAFRWTAETGMVALDLVPDFGTNFGASEAFAANADGSVVVGVDHTAQGPRAFRWTAETGMVGLGFLPGDTFSYGFSVNADGSVIVGGSGRAGRLQAFRWENGSMVGLGDLPGGNFFSQALAVSADGSAVVGTGRSSSGNEAFQWTSDGGMVGLGDLPGGSFGSIAKAVSNDGSIVVGESIYAVLGQAQAFRWTAETGMVGLGFVPGSAQSDAKAVNANGSIVVGGGDVVGGFIWDAVHGMRSLSEVLVNDYNLDLTGWTLTSATGISADGKVIVGTGRNPNFQVEAWIAIIPEPASLALLLAGLIAMFLHRPAATPKHRRLVGIPVVKPFPHFQGGSTR